jgi:hypothetical protein
LSPIANVISTTLNQTFEYSGTPLTPSVQVESSTKKLTPARYISTTKPETPKNISIVLPETPQKENINPNIASTPIDKSSSLKSAKDTRLELDSR